jgi:hypothetical protein
VLRPCRVSPCWVHCVCKCEHAYVLRAACMARAPRKTFWVFLNESHAGPVRFARLQAERREAIVAAVAVRRLYRVQAQSARRRSQRHECAPACAAGVAARGGNRSRVNQQVYKLASMVCRWLACHRPHDRSRSVNNILARATGSAEHGRAACKRLRCPVLQRRRCAANETDQRCDSGPTPSAGTLFAPQSPARAVFAHSRSSVLHRAAAVRPLLRLAARAVACTIARLGKTMSRR